MPDVRVRKGKCPERIMLYFAFLAKLERKSSTLYVIQKYSVSELFLSDAFSSSFLTSWPHAGCLVNDKLKHFYLES